MTPKEKCDELIVKMAIELVDGTSRYDLQPNFKIAKNQYAKECALIAVDEILGHMGADRGYAFWTEVKMEIQKL
jgi:hypothetical protein